MTEHTAYYVRRLLDGRTVTVGTLSVAEALARITNDALNDRGSEAGVAIEEDNDLSVFYVTVEP